MGVSLRLLQTAVGLIVMGSTGFAGVFVLTFHPYMYLIFEGQFVGEAAKQRGRREATFST